MTCPEVAMYRVGHVPKWLCTELDMSRSGYVPSWTCPETVMSRNGYVPKRLCPEVVMSRNGYAPYKTLSAFSPFILSAFYLNLFRYFVFLVLSARTNSF